MELMKESLEVKFMVQKDSTKGYLSPILATTVSKVPLTMSLHAARRSTNRASYGKHPQI